MTRSRASAKAAGSRFERLIADYLKVHVDDRIDRRVKTGRNDRGDLASFRSPHGHRLVGECKDRARMDLAGAAAEAEVERRNDDAIAALIFHKRHGVAAPGLQWVTCTVDDMIALITGTRPSGDE